MYKKFNHNDDYIIEYLDFNTSKSEKFYGKYIDSVIKNDLTYTGTKIHSFIVFLSTTKVDHTISLYDSAIKKISLNILELADFYK